MRKKSKLKFSQIEKTLIWRSVLYSIDKEDSSSVMLPIELVKYLQTKNLTDKDAVGLSNLIMDNLQKYISDRYNIRFGNYKYPYDIFYWIDKLINEFHINDINDFKIPRTLYIDKNDEMYDVKYLKHKQKEIYGFDTFISWYNLAKFLNKTFWLSIETCYGEEIIMFKTYHTNPITGLLEEVFYTLYDFIHNPVNTKPYPIEFIKKIKEYK